MVRIDELQLTGVLKRLAWKGTICLVHAMLHGYRERQTVIKRIKHSDHESTVNGNDGSPLTVELWKREFANTTYGLIDQ